MRATSRIINFLKKDEFVHDIGKNRIAKYSIRIEINILVFFLLGYSVNFID